MVDEGVGRVIVGYGPSTVDGDSSTGWACAADAAPSGTVVYRCTFGDGSKISTDPHG